MYKQINLAGLVIWIPLYLALVPITNIQTYPLILLGFIYTLLILFLNYNNLDDNKYSDLNENTFKLINFVNTKAVHVATAVFALAIATKNIFKNHFDKILLKLIIFTLLFGVGMILPVYFIASNNKEILIKKNNELIVIRNVFLSYSIGFMVSAFMLVLNRIYLNSQK
jgi:hypothetical protein